MLPFTLLTVQCLKASLTSVRATREHLWTAHGNLIMNSATLPSIGPVVCIMLKSLRLVILIS